MIKKVLIVDDQTVDDQTEVRELVNVSLQLGDYEVRDVKNGDEAVLEAKEFMPDLMLLDINMPGGSIDGYGVCERIKGNPETSKFTVVMLSSNSREVDIEKGKKAGCNSYPTKPFSPFELMQEVEKYLK